LSTGPCRVAAVAGTVAAAVSNDSNSKPGNTTADTETAQMQDHMQYLHAHGALRDKNPQSRSK